jgi:hypothetical protein
MKELSSCCAIGWKTKSSLEKELFRKPEEAERASSKQQQKLTMRLRRSDSSRPVANSVEHNSCRQRVLAGFSTPDLSPQLVNNGNDEKKNRIQSKCSKGLDKN